MSESLDGKKLQGKVAIVTGGGSGIGKETAIEFARNGAIVCLADVSESNLKETKESLDLFDSNSTQVFKVDVSNEADAKNVIDSINDQLGRIDILFNNAGISGWKSIENTSTEEWKRVLDVNLNAQFYMIKHSVKSLKKTKGVIVNTASTLGLFGARNSLSYCVSKSAVIGLTKASALDLAQYGIRVNCIAPGSIDTKMVKEELSQLKDPEAGRRAYEKMYPMGRIGKPEEVGKLVVFLASDDSSFITGSVFVIDGGLGAMWPESLARYIKL